ncbi:MAG: hypothetical protein WBV37_15775 [Nocardioidaceae bacterium]
MSFSLAVVHRDVGFPVRRPLRSAHSLFPYAARAVLLARAVVRHGSAPRCRNQGVDVSWSRIGCTETVNLDT